MKTTGNQKRIYLLALFLLLVAAALAFAWTMLGDRASLSNAAVTPAATAEVSYAPVVTPAPAAEEAQQSVSSSAVQQTVSTVVYYQDNYGYLVPVMCNVAYEDGIAKATLRRMVQSPENDMAAARLGLRTVLPENTSIDLDIHDGLARIDLGKEVLGMADAAAETNMISAIVQALTEFDSVERVEFLVGGQKLEKLTHGTDISKIFTRGEINLETSAAMGGDVAPVTLYFPCESGSVVVPVTRMVYSNADVNTAVLELAKGPSTRSPLERALPAGCGLIDVEMDGGVVKVNFTKEFAGLVENSDGGRLALKALVLTCSQFEGVEEVQVFVEGEPYDPGKDALSVPSFANVASEIEENYIQTQAQLIFDFE